MIEDLIGFNLAGLTESINAITIRSTLYVDPINGNDANTGFNWTHAFRTIAAAQNALPANGGTIELGYGDHNVTSVGRFDSCTFTSGNATVADASAAAGDVGSFVISQYLGDQAKIVSVVPGVSFTIDAASTVTGSGTTNAIITVPAISLLPGVELYGRGSSYDRTVSVQLNALPSTTRIVDSGTGITIMNQNAGPTHPGQTAQRWGLKHLSVVGNANAIMGMYGQNVWYQVAEDVDFHSYGVAGAGLSINVNCTPFRDCRFMLNGKNNATNISAGMLLNTPVLISSGGIQFNNCFFSDNFGHGVCSTFDWVNPAPAAAGTYIGCTWNNTRRTPIGAALSGWSVYLSGANGNCALIGCWMETADTGNIHGTPAGGSITDLASVIRGNGFNFGANAYCVQLEATGGGAFNAISSTFQQATTAAVLLASGVTFNWNACVASLGGGSTSLAVDTNGVVWATTPQAPGVGSTLYPVEPLSGLAGTMLTAGQEFFHRLLVQNSSAASAVSGTIHLTYFTARKTETETQIRFAVGNTAAGATPTFAGMALYQVNADASLTLLNSTANNTALFAATFSDSVASLLAGVPLIAGQRYAAAILVVSAAAMPKFYGIASLGDSATAPRLCAAVPGQSGFPASIASASLSATNAAMFFGYVNP